MKKLFIITVFIGTLIYILSSIDSNIDNIKYFNENQDKVLSKLRTEFSKKNYSFVFKETQKYLPSRHEEIKQLHIKSKKKETRRILNELKSVPVNEYEKNKNLYAKLFNMYPKNKKYYQKYNFYNEKVQTERKCRNKDSRAFVASQSVVERRLKSPSTAMFPSSSSEGVKIRYAGDCIYEIWAYVDAQNSFGAIIRNQYYVKIKKTMMTLG